jgi:hypothetical protein
MPGLPLGWIHRVEFGGALGAETWESGFWFASDAVGFFSPAQHETALTAIDTEIAGIWTDFLKGWNASGLSLTFSRLRTYNNGAPEAVSQHALTVAAASGTAPQPGFTAQCISLYTDVPSRRTRGRAYLPRTGNAPSASTFQWASIATALGQLKTHLHNMSTALDGLPSTSGSRLAVVSRQGGDPVNVTRLRADSKPDTQHGRTSKMSPATLDVLAY